MTISETLVKELRERTGAGMMECKKALTENNGDIDAAAEWLRKSGLAKADKKASRVAAEGRIAVAQDAGKAVLVEINSETDFVAKDVNFVAFTDAVAQAALASGATDAEALKSAKLPSGETVEEARAAAIAKLGENILVRRIATISSSNETTFTTALACTVCRANFNRPTSKSISCYNVSLVRRGSEHN